MDTLPKPMDSKPATLPGIDALHDSSTPPPNDDSFSAFASLTALALQPTGITRGPNPYDFQQSVLDAQVNLHLAADSFAAEGLEQLSEQIKFGSTSDAMGMIGSAIGAMGTLMGGFSQLSPIGGILGFVGALFGMGNNSMGEIKKGLEQLGTNLEVMNNNLLNISKQIEEGLTELSREIRIIFDRINQLQTDVDMDNLTRLIDENMTPVMIGITKFLNALQNEPDEAYRINLAKELTSTAFLTSYGNLYKEVVGTPNSLSDNSFLDLLNNKLHLADGNIPYDLWYQGVQYYMAKVNFPLVIGSMAICWAIDLVGTNSEKQVASQTYNAWYLAYFRKLQSVEPGLFMPLNGTNVISLDTEMNTALTYTFTRHASGDILVISNPHDYPVALRQLQILTNFSMSNPTVGFWGDMLWRSDESGWDGSLANTEEPVQQTVIYDHADSEEKRPLFAAYVIQYNEDSYFEPGGTATLNMSFSSTDDWKAEGLSGLKGAALLPAVSLVNGERKQKLTMTELSIIDAQDKKHTLPEVRPSQLQAGKRIVGYFPDYAMYNPQFPFFATDVPYHQINVLAYCFGQFNADGEVYSFDPWADSYNLPVVQQVLAKNKYLLAELVFGGWPDENIPEKDFNAKFRSISSDADKRKAFAANAVRTMMELGFTGLGIDWEYPEPKDAENYILMLEELRLALVRVGGPQPLSIAAPASLEKINYLTEEQWVRLCQTVDYVNVMTYDYNGAWSEITDFMEPLEVSTSNPLYEATKHLSVKGTMGYFVALAEKYDLPREKFAMGVAAYGRALQVDPEEITKDNQALYVPHQLGQVPTPIPEPAEDVEVTGVYTNKEIFSGQGFPEDMVWINGDDDDKNRSIVENQSAWGYSKTAGWFISYDNQRSVKQKLAYANAEELGGVILWDLAGDPSEADQSLLKVIYENYEAPETE